MRLAKFLARAGVSSRRRAEQLIFEGRVTVNDVQADQPQLQVTSADKITVDDQVVGSIENKVYILLNKPPGYISTVKDTHERPTVIDLINSQDARVYPVGRLDADTSGVLLLTNDGELANRLMHPRHMVEKVYHAWVYGVPGPESLEKLKKGPLIEGEKRSPARFKILEKDLQKNIALLEIALTEGKKRQVKKLCQAIGHPVKKLIRFSFAGLDAGNLKEGSYRYLQKDEINYLYDLVKL